MTGDLWLFWTVVDAVLLLAFIAAPFAAHTRLGARLTGAANPEKEDR